MVLNRNAIVSYGLAACIRCGVFCLLGLTWGEVVGVFIVGAVAHGSDSGFDSSVYSPATESYSCTPNWTGCSNRTVINNFKLYVVNANRVYV